MTKTTPPSITKRIKEKNRNKKRREKVWYPVFLIIRRCGALTIRKDPLRRAALEPQRVRGVEPHAAAMYSERTAFVAPPPPQNTLIEVWRRKAEEELSPVLLNLSFVLPI